MSTRTKTSVPSSSRDRDALQRILDAERTSTLDLHRLVFAGTLRSGILSSLRTKLALTNDEFASLIGISKKTIGRRAPSTPLSLPEADRVVRVMRVFNAAAEAIGDAEHARRWLRTANVALDGEVPLHLLETEPGVTMVMSVLDRIAYGGVA